jgi:hypothetical protein
MWAQTFFIGSRSKITDMMAQEKVNKVNVEECWKTYLLNEYSVKD